MKKFLSTHPWRLEIVPALTVLWCLGAIAYYYLRVPYRFYLCTGDSCTQWTPGTTLIWMTLVAICYWTIEIGVNHKWVLSERRKRFNYIALIFQLPMLVKACLVFLILEGLTHYAQFETPWMECAAILLTGICVTAVMEATRVHVPEEATEPSPPPDVISSHGEFCYSEVSVDWSTVVCSASLVILCCFIAVETRSLWITLITLCGAGLLAWMSYRKITITSYQIQSSIGPFKKRVRVSGIFEYREGYHEYFAKKTSGGRRSAQGGFGPCIEIKTTDGKTHLFCMLRPHFGCSLIESATSKHTPGSA